MKEILINTIDELIHKINSFDNCFIYRGQANSNWNLETGLERLLASKCNKSTIRSLEIFSLHKFQSKFHIYNESDSKPQTDLQWLSLMQHYGIPTRLLDFTESPYIALYFAIENYDMISKNDIAVFAIDYRNLMKKSINFIKSKDTDFNYEYLEALRNPDTIFTKTIDRFSYDILWMFEPFESNSRLDRQAGCFLISGNKDKTLNKLLNSEIYNDVEMQKIIISSDLVEQIFTLLLRTNTTSKVLYGDLVGLAKSIKMELEFYNN